MKSKQTRTVTVPGIQRSFKCRPTEAVPRPLRALPFQFLALFLKRLAAEITSLRCLANIGYCPEIPGDFKTRQYEKSLSRRGWLWGEPIIQPAAFVKTKEVERGEFLENSMTGTMSKKAKSGNLPGDAVIIGYIGRHGLDSWNLKLPRKFGRRSLLTSA